MKVTTTLECRARVVAALEEDGTLSVKVFGQAEYAPERTTTAEGDVPDAQRDQVRTALQAALEAAAPSLGPRLATAVHKSAEVAAAHGEI